VGGYIALIVIVCVLVLAAIGVMLFCFLRHRGYIGGASSSDAAATVETVVNNSFYDPKAATTSGAANGSDTFLSAREATPASQRTGTMASGTMSSFGGDTTQLMRPMGAGANGGTLGTFTSASAFDLPSPGTSYPGRSMTSVTGMSGNAGHTLGARSMTSVEAPGNFVCPVCAKVYQYKTDLDTHRQLRHP